MPKRTDRPIDRRHIGLYEGQWDRLQHFFGSTIGASHALREIAERTLRRLEAKEAADRRDIDVNLDDVVPGTIEEIVNG